VVHGKPSSVTHDGRGLYDGVADPCEVGRYHSLTVERDELPAELEETAYTTGNASGGRADGGHGIVMGVRHVDRPHVGMQFHPESILTGEGKRIVENFCTALVTA
jgi:anthranilate synthase component 2